MNEEKLNQLAAEIEAVIQAEIDSVISDEDIESMVSRTIESEMDNIKDTLTESITRELTSEGILGNLDILGVITEKLTEALAKDAEQENEPELKYKVHPNGMMYFRYNGSQPQTVSELIDAIIVLTSDEQSVVQFFNRIATLREYAIAIKSKRM